MAARRGGTIVSRNRGCRTRSPAGGGVEAHRWPRRGAMLAAVARAGRGLCRAWAAPGGAHLSSWLPQTVPFRGSHWQSSLLAFRALLPVRAQPKKKKKVDVRREQAQKDRMKKKIKKLERAAPELIPIEDFIPPLKYSDSSRVRNLPPLSFEETERRVLLLKKWCLFKQKQDKTEKKAIQSLVQAQQEALRELQLESEELYQAAIRRDEGLFPFERDGPNYTPPLPGYDPPEGKCVDITKVYTQ